MNDLQYSLSRILTKNFSIKTDDADFWHNFINTKETIFFEMESKLNEDALKSYSQDFSEKLMKNFYANHEFALGEDILRLSEIPQINYFIISQLFSNWRKEISLMESPYFDFRSKDVKKALKDFGNVLSRNIKVSQKHLMPFVVKAVEDTLLLILSPYDFYCSIIKNWGQSTIKLKELNSFGKYVKINSNLMASFMRRFEGSDEKEVSPDDALRILNEVFAETTQTPEDIDPFISKFSSALPLDVGKIYGEETVTTNKNESDSVAAQGKKEKPLTLNDQIAKKEEKTILADLHKKKKIDNIKSNLSINQKFMFVNQLFGGNSDDFNKVIDFLDNCSSQAEAMDFINKNYLKKNNWKKDSIEVKEFIEVIAKKYGSDVKL